MPITLHDLTVVEAIARLPSNTILKPEEAAVFLRVSPKTLERYRSVGGGPPYIQNNQEDSTGANRSVRYIKSDLEQWVSAQRVGSTLDAAVKRGQMFSSIHDLAAEVPVWLDPLGRVDCLVESMDVDLIIERILSSEYAIEFSDPFDVLAMPWLDELSRADYFKSMLSFLYDLNAKAQAFFDQGTLTRAMECGDSSSRNEPPLSI